MKNIGDGKRLASFESHNAIESMTNIVSTSDGKNKEEENIDTTLKSLI